MKNYLILFLLFSTSLFNKAYSQWSDVKLGTNSAINEFYIDSTSNLLFVGGQFSTAGGMNINNIATWDGANWNSFGSNEKFSSPGAVSAIVNYNGSIIVGGQFDSIGTVTVNNIAKWNGASWEPIGYGFDRYVTDLIVYRSELYACGSFAYSGLDRVECFAKWNGTNWVEVSQLLGRGTSFEIYNGNLIIAGSFNHQTISNVVSIMGWNGIDIDSSLGYFSNAVINIRNIDDTLYAVGSFTSNISNPSNYISLYYNHSWHSIGNPTGSLNWITDVLKYNNQLYLCGYFTNPPDLCTYNGSGFDSVAEVLGFVQYLTEYKGKLYAGGSYSHLNGVAINNIAQYNDIGNYLVDNLLTNENINIYPNPNYDGNFHLNINVGKFADQIKINVYTIDGIIVFANKLEKAYSGNFTIQIPAKPGIYFLRCENKDGIISVKKIIIL